MRQGRGDEAGDEEGTGDDGQGLMQQVAARRGARPLEEGDEAARRVGERQAAEIAININ